MTPRKTYPYPTLILSLTYYANNDGGQARFCGHGHHDFAHSKNPFTNSNDNDLLNELVISPG